MSAHVVERAENNFYKYENMQKIIDLANEYPNINLTLTAEQLIEAINYCVTKIKEEFEESKNDSKNEACCTIAEAARELQVSKPTLWRWAKQGYLVPVSIGGKRRYKMSEINSILNKKLC